MGETAKDKLDAALGINGNIDDYLSDLTSENSAIASQLNTIDNAVKMNVDKIDTEIKKFESTGVANLADVGASLDQIGQLVDVSKGIIKRVYDEVVGSTLLDPEIIQAAAKMIEATRVTVADYLDLYKHRVDFYDKVRLEMIKQEHKKELMQLKKSLEAENIQETATDMVSFNQEDIVKAIVDAQSMSSD